MLDYSKVSDYVKQETEKFAKEHRMDEHRGSKYTILCVLNFLPTKEVACLDMTLLDKEGEVYSNPRKKTTMMIDKNIFN